MDILEIFTVLPQLFGLEPPSVLEPPKDSKASRVSNVTEIPDPPIRQMRSYQGRGVVSIAERSQNGEPLGFTNLGGCSELTLSLRVHQKKHLAIVDGRWDTDYIAEQCEVLGSMRLDVSAKENLSRYSNCFVALLINGLQVEENTVRVHIFKARFDPVEGATVAFNCLYDRLRSKSGGFFTEVNG